ncbi:unnamed protein product, partial [Meganyctiphanes norvegica]
MTKQNCLIVLSASELGVSAPSFLQCYKLTQSALNIHITTPQGSKPAISYRTGAMILPDVPLKGVFEPRHLFNLPGSQYSCVVIPHSPGATDDLAQDNHIGNILTHCLAERKPVCAVGLGVCALLSAKNGEDWAFRDIALTGSSLSEVASLPVFPRLPVLPGDAVLDRGGVFSTGAPSSIHIVVNAGVITGQNQQSTLSAVQNMILLVNQRQSKSK